MDKNNYCIILAGGIGSKLWPMITGAKPKQFLDLFATGRSMLQLTYDRYSRLVPKENIFISTYKEYADIVRDQLPELAPDQVVLEPLQMSTAPAVALTLMHILARNPDANVISAPSDQLVYDRDTFERQIMEGLRFIDKTGDFLAIGIKPTRPATSYGYLQASVEGKDGFFRLKSFTEKPNIDFARLFCESGEFYWSTGIFMWNAKTMLKAMEEDYPYIERMAALMSGHADMEKFTAMITEQYPRIRFQSVDLLILEHRDNVFIAPCTFGWADVGSWKNYYDLQGKDADGNVANDSRNLLYSCKNSLVKVSSDKVVILQDLEGYMVVENEKMLMVCKKDDPAFVRRIMNDAQMKFGDDIM